MAGKLAADAEPMSGTMYSITFGMTMCVIYLSVILFIPGVNGAAVDVALNKPIKAEITCGRAGVEEYYDHDQVRWGLIFNSTVLSRI